jgi:hypothetical protein
MLTRLNPLAVAAVILIALVLLASACGGNDRRSTEDGEATLPAPPIIETPGSQDSISGASGGENDPGETPVSGRGLPTADSLNALPSYRYQLVVEGEGSVAESFDLAALTGAAGTADAFKYTIKGAWIAPDKAQVEMDFAGRAIRQTIIGQQQWVTVAGVTGSPLPADGAAAELTYGAAFISQEIVDAALRDFDCDHREEIAGLRTVRCEGDIDDFNRTQDQFGSIFDGTTVSDVTAFEGTLWIAEDLGYPVKAKLHLGGKTTDGKDFTLGLSLDVTDIGRVTEITP